MKFLNNSDIVTSSHLGIYDTDQLMKLSEDHTTTDKVDKAKSIEGSEQNLEIIKEGETKND